MRRGTPEKYYSYIESIAVIIFQIQVGPLVMGLPYIVEII